jgi:hypothetical protein
MSFCASLARGQRAESKAETLTVDEQRPVRGRLVGLARGELAFLSEHDGKPRALERGAVVTFAPADGEPAAASAPFHVLLGAGGRLSGRLLEVTASEIRFAEGPSDKPFTVARGGAVAVVQRPGEALVVFEPFDTLLGRGWSLTGEAEIDADERASASKSLKLPSHGASVTLKLPEPIGSGRFEVSYYDGEEVVAGCRQLVDLSFRLPSHELAPIRVILGWNDETLAVESPQGPALAVQRLSRRKGWHRLGIQFGPERLDIQVDNEVLAHGNGPTGPLSEIRLATEVLRNGKPSSNQNARFDDLQLVRIASPPGRLNVDPSQDEARMITGDQTFGWVVKADAKRVILEQDNKEIPLPWSEVAGIYFRRRAETAAPIDGTLVRAEWKSKAPPQRRESDLIEGALVGVTDSELTFAVPYAGLVVVPRDRMIRVEVIGRGRHLVIDPHAHHLGDRIVSDLDPAQPEGGAYELEFNLRQVPEAPATLVLDVVQVVGEAGDAFSPQVKNGELVTRVLLNGKAFDTLNRHIRTKNDTPERIRLSIPAGALRAGKNLLRFEQEGTKMDPAKRDNLGLQGIAVDFELSRSAGTTRP